MITKHPRMTLTTAFIAGILLTLGFKDLYPYLKRRIRRQRWRSSPSTTPASVFGEGTRKVILEDNSTSNHLEVLRSDISEGIEGCIGDTPLIRIKSLSEATGCEILGKAEFLNGAGNSPKDRVALSMIQM
ncbi:Cysteine synthase 2, partial [Cryomyces antarcticus]